MKDHLWFDAIGWVGAAALLVAYAMVSARKWEGHSSVFQFLNVGGSLLLAANTIFYGSYPSTFVNLGLGSHCHFHNRYQETGFVSLV